MGLKQYVRTHCLKLSIHFALTLFVENGGPCCKLSEPCPYHYELIGLWNEACQEYQAPREQMEILAKIRDGRFVEVWQGE